MQNTLVRDLVAFLMVVKIVSPCWDILDGDMKKLSQHCLCLVTRGHEPLRVWLSQRGARRARRAVLSVGIWAAPLFLSFPLYPDWVGCWLPPPSVRAGLLSSLASCWNPLLLDTECELRFDHLAPGRAFVLP